jgi:hypothetical protein
MRFRKLRIAWSVFWGLACVLLIVLWVRSYWWDDYEHGPLIGRQVDIQSYQGRMTLAVFDPPDTEWEFKVCKLYDTSVPPSTPVWFFERLRSIRYWGIGFTHWFPTFVLAIIAALPWIRWSKRFSLRTLLIAPTLLAAALGLMARSIR